MADPNDKKRRAPPALRILLDLDVAVTNKFCAAVTRAAPHLLQRKHHKVLEISCHGVPWLVGWVAYMLLTTDPSLYQLQANFLYGLLLDVIAITVIKAFVRRRRPAGNESDMFMTVGPDKFSFPSGHASRAVFISHFFIYYLELSLLALPLVAWSASVCVSRVLLRRHHVFDVICGALLGIVESLFVFYFWLGQDTCLWIISIFTS
ncbi:phospholipid phosphatase 6-like [Thrips palmi]|uniref:Phospholipid phosphatase 6-like n=1 Tax=Thrips palmi TaxID=161013 RepID=A0A6P8YWM4_THRPL|nr:phospholipid phosphatase 6-like [Thrips palmi]